MELLQQAKADPVVMAIKGSSTFSQAPGLESYNQIQFSAISKTHFEGVSYPSVKMHSANSTAPADWDNFIVRN